MPAKAECRGPKADERLLALAAHFRGKKPEIRALFDAVVAVIRDIGPVRILRRRTWTTCCARGSPRPTASANNAI